MAKDKKSFLLYTDQQGVFNQLPDEIAGKLIKHIFAYVNDENPLCEDLLLSIAFEPIKLQLKRDLRKYDEYIDKQKLNGLKGGRPKKANETQETQAFFEEPKKADNDNDNVNDNDTDNEIKDINGVEVDSKKEMKNDGPRAVIKPEYQVSFDLWFRYKKEKRQGYQKTGMEQLVKTMQGKYTAEQFTQCVEYSITQNYQGIYEPKDFNKTPITTQPTLKKFNIADYE